MAGAVADVGRRKSWVFWCGNDCTFQVHFPETGIIPPRNRTKTAITSQDQIKGAAAWLESFGWGEQMGELLMCYWAKAKHRRLEFCSYSTRSCHTLSCSCPECSPAKSDDDGILLEISVWGWREGMKMMKLSSQKNRARESTKWFFWEKNLRKLRATAHAADPKDKTWWPEVVTCMTLSTPDQWNIPRPKHHLDTSRKPPKPQAKKLFHVTFGIHIKQSLEPLEPQSTCPAYANTIWNHIKQLWSHRAHAQPMQTPSGHCRCKKTQTPSRHEPKTAQTASQKTVSRYLWNPHKTIFGATEHMPSLCKHHLEPHKTTLEPQSTCPAYANTIWTLQMQKDPNTI